jgi:hypothetical protein
MRTCLLVFLIVLATSIAVAQVSVNIPFRTCARDSTIYVPLFIRGVTGQNILAFQFTVAFNKAVVKVTDIETEGTISKRRNWMVLPNAYADSIKIGGYGDSVLVGMFDPKLRDTVLLKLKCTSVGNLNDTCRLQLKSFILNGGTPTVIVSSERFEVGTTSVRPWVSEVPASVELSQNYPNPFNPSTNIQFTLPRRSHVTLALYTALGELARVVIDLEMEAGYHDVVLDASGLSSGTYFYRLNAGDVAETKRLMLLK